MTMLRLIGSVSAAVLISSVWLAPTASAQASCDWYAKTALKQQQENEQRKCGLKGNEWSTDLRAHLSWCRSVAPDAWKKQAQLRDQQLAACAKR
jgi:hypothetical protein